jgi:RimJ/RimL family protein N-acetyltransferase
MVRLESDRLILRNYEERDRQDFFEYMSLEYTAQHEDFDPLTAEESVQYLKHRIGDDRYLVVECKENGKVIGDLSCCPEEFGTYCISYDFNVKFEKQGYATEACRTFIEYIFRSLNGRRIYAECNEENANSVRLLKRLGFRQEGHFIEDVSFKKDDAGNPIYINSYLYALLKREWIVNNSIA